MGNGLFDQMSAWAGGDWNSEVNGTGSPRERAGRGGKEVREEGSLDPRVQIFLPPFPHLTTVPLSLTAKEKKHLNTEKNFKPFESSLLMLVILLLFLLQGGSEK